MTVDAATTRPRADLATIALIGLSLSCSRTVPANTPAAVRANPDEVETTIFLIGDAGAPSKDEPVLKALSAQVGDTPGEPVIVFLGDNIYPRGLPDSGNSDHKDAENRLQAQIDVSKERNATTIFVPGNHDWDYMGPDGWEAIKRQGDYITQHGGSPKVALLPAGGCPGPEWLDVGAHVRLVMLDTQWWLHRYPKPLHPESHCRADSRAEIAESLGAALGGAGKRQVIVVAHHPLRSGGTHGGHFSRRAYLIPIIPLMRRQGASDQDLSGPRNVRMRQELEAVLRKYKPLAYVSGHDHDLQVLRGESARHLLVSGAGIYGHFTPVAWRGYTRFAAAASGFMRLDVLKDGRVRLAVMTVDAKAEPTERFSMYLE